MARKKRSKKNPSPPPGNELCKRLQDVVEQLDLIHDVIVVCSQKAMEQNAEHDSEVSKVLRVYGTNKLFNQMVALTEIIEKLGGTTPFSERDDEEEND